MTCLRRVVFLLALFFVGCSIAKKQEDAGVIVSAEWLQSWMEEPSLLLFHVGTPEVYDSTHIPGARLLDPYEFTVSSEGLRNQIPEADSVRTLLSSLGISRDSRVVLYYENEQMITRTARVYLTLDYAGYGEQSHVLNGGMDGWFETSSGSKDVKEKLAGDSKVNAEKGERAGKQVTISAKKLDQHRWDPDYVLVDVRSPEEYYGEIDSIAQAGSRGHIEGAYYMNYRYLLSETNPQRIKTKEELVKEFKNLGMDREKTAVFYCGSGVRASLAYLVARHLNYPALLYDGSIQEWEELGLPQTSPVIESELNK